MAIKTNLQITTFQGLDLGLDAGVLGQVAPDQEVVIPAPALPAQQPVKRKEFSFSKHSLERMVSFADSEHAQKHSRISGEESKALSEDPATSRRAKNRYYKQLERKRKREELLQRGSAGSVDATADSVQHAAAAILALANSSANRDYQAAAGLLHLSAYGAE